ncbi:MAG: RNA pseudouridine synthase [Rhizobiales bacterium]|nr:RNA pseudouridine synthase [Hyphomicrobiales bacterium]
MTPEEIVARLIYRDGLMLIIDKPIGYAVHKGPKGGESLEDYFGALRFGLPRSPALAHRLDRDTSGCLVLGRHRKALATLGKLFKDGRVGKTYWAVVEGGPADDEGRIDLPLGKRDDTRGWWMKVDSDGQPAVTTWRVMGRCSLFTVSADVSNTEADPALGDARAAGGSPPPIRDANGGEGPEVGGAETEHKRPPTPNPSPPLASARGGRGTDPSRSDNVEQSRDRPASLTWLALEPLTGRTHQLRVHCSAMGWPIVGDTIYGDAPRTGGPGLHLHAREVVVPLYKNKEPVRATAPVPLHMQDRLYACGWKGEVFTLVD